MKRLAMVGTGQIAGAHLNGVRALVDEQGGRRISVSAVVDALPSRAQEWVKQNFAADPKPPSILDDYRQLLEPQHRPDMVSILVPHHLHLEIGRQFLEAGIAVQMQKPIGLAIRDSHELIAVAKRTRTPLVVSEPSVLGRKTRLVLDWLRSGRQIGRPTLMLDQSVIDLRGGFFMTPWRHLKGMAGAGWFIDHGVHRTHWMLEAFGSCETVFAFTRQLEPVRENERWGRVAVDTEDLAVAVLRFKSGMIVQWTVASGGRGATHRHVELWAERGSFYNEKYTLSGERDPRELELDDTAVPHNVPADAFAHSYAELLARMENPDAPIIGEPARAVEAEAMVYACLESAHTGKPVSVEDVLTGRACAYEQTVWQANERERERKMAGLT